MLHIARIVTRALYVETLLELETFLRRNTLWSPEGRLKRGRPKTPWQRRVETALQPHQ